MKNKRLHQALIDFFKSDDGKEIIQQALNQALTREMTFEKARDEYDRPITPPRRKTETVNVIDQILVYLSRTEGAWRGVQNDLNARENEIKALTAKYIEEQQRVVAAFKFIGGKLENLMLADDEKQEVRLIK